MKSKPDIKDLRIQELERVIESLTGKGYEVAGYHLNGELEPLDNLLEITPPAIPPFDFVDRFVAVSERDTYDFMTSNGAIVWETYLAGSDASGVIKRAFNIGKYGEIHICKLERIGTLEQFKKMVDAKESDQ